MRKQKNNKPIRKDECWNSVGVYGDSSCPELAHYTHCDYCPVYLRSGRNIYDSEVPPDIIAEWTELYKHRKTPESPNAVVVVEFRILNEWFAMKAECFQEMSAVRPIHYVPFRSDGRFLGLVNIKGVLLPCISVEELFGMSSAGDVPDEGGTYRNMLVMSDNGERFVFPVHEVAGIRLVALPSLRKVPSTLEKARVKHMSNIYEHDNKTVGFLNENALFKSLKGILVF